MGDYRIRSTGQIKSQGAIRQMHANTSLPRVWDETICNDLGIDPILEGPQATGGDHYQYSMRQGIEEINGKWYTKYVLGPIFTDYTQEDGTVLTAAEQEAAYRAGKDSAQADSVRTDRDKRLSDCDWTQVADVPVDQTAWATYRQALRDVPAQAGFPWNITWPETP